MFFGSFAFFAEFTGSGFLFGLICWPSVASHGRKDRKTCDDDKARLIFCSGRSKTAEISSVNSRMAMAEARRDSSRRSVFESETVKIVRRKRSVSYCSCRLSSYAPNQEAYSAPGFFSHTWRQSDDTVVYQERRGGRSFRSVGWMSSRSRHQDLALTIS